MSDDLEDSVKQSSVYNKQGIKSTQRRMSGFGYQPQKKKNPGLEINDFVAFAKSVLVELNIARSKPLTYSRKLEKIMKEDFSETQQMIRYINKTPIQTKEGKGAFQEAIKFLNNVRPLNVVKTNRSITKSAEDLVSSLTLHEGDDFNNFGKINVRMNKYGVTFGDVIEIVDYGNFTPEEVIVNFLVCDGDTTRKERAILFTNTCSCVGIASGLMPSEKVCTVINFAEYFFEKGDLIPSYLIEGKNTKKVDVEPETQATYLHHNHEPGEIKQPIQSCLSQLDNEYIMTTRSNNPIMLTDRNSVYTNNQRSRSPFSYERPYEYTHGNTIKIEDYTASIRETKPVVLDAKIQPKKSNLIEPLATLKGNSALEFDAKNKSAMSTLRDFFIKKPMNREEIIKEDPNRFVYKKPREQKRNSRTASNIVNPLVKQRLDVSKEQPHFILNNEMIDKIENDFANYEINSDISRISYLPDNVESVQFSEKPLNNLVDDENPGVYRPKLIKKAIQFKDGTYEAILYHK